MLPVCARALNSYTQAYNREDTNGYLISKTATGRSWVAVINLPV